MGGQSVELKFETDDCCITISESETAKLRRVAIGGAVGAPDWARIIAIATCVMTCIGSTSKTSNAPAAKPAGGAHETPKSVEAK